MQPDQFAQLAQLQQRLGMGDGELWDLARRISHNEALVSFSELSWSEASEMLGFLELYEKQRVAEKFNREAVMV